MWLVLHERLPTLEELRHRGIQLNSNCTWCNNGVEDIDHLLWNCTLAKLCWKVLEQWFEIRVTNIRNTRDFFLSASKIKDGEGLQTCISATMWTIWLTRNKLLFNNTRSTTRAIEGAIKSLAWEWSASSKLISDKGFVLWNHNPQGAYVNNKKEELHNMLKLWFSQFNLVGFIDGAVEVGKQNPRSGVGGFLMDCHKHTWFIFSGPSPFTSSHSTKELALRLMLEAISNKKLENLKIVIATESITLFNIYHIPTHPSVPTHPIRQILLGLPNINLVLINRRFNSQADSLAQLGKKGNRLLASWPHLPSTSISTTPGSRGD